MIDAAIEGLLGILQWKAFLLMMVGIIVSSTLVAMPDWKQDGDCFDAVHRLRPK